MQRVLVRDRVWRVQSTVATDDGRQFLTLLDPESAEILKVLSPPERVEHLSSPAPVFVKESLSPWTPWYLDHKALMLCSATGNGGFEAIASGRISPEPYQFAPIARMLNLPRPSLLIADDVGLGKTIEAGICLQELIARGRGKRILLVVPPGLIPQWQDEMLEKFGLEFHAIENASSLERTQTNLSEGVKPWGFLDRVITSVEYLKKREVMVNALETPWDAIVVDEAHYLAESGTPRNPYTTARARLGRRLRDACWALILLTATPHNGYRHSFRSLLEIVEPTDATFEGDTEIIRRRVSRAMIRRLKSQIYKTDENGARIPAFQPREPIRQIRVEDLSDVEKEIFKKVSSYCARTAKAAEGTEGSELVGFAMQIIKKRMLSCRTALANTVRNRLDALGSRQPVDEPPPRSELREFQGDIPLGDATLERIQTRIVRSSIPKETRQRSAEKRQLKEIAGLLDRLEGRPDPKITALVADLKTDVIAVDEEKAIVFTEYRDTLKAVREAFQGDPDLRDRFVELTGGLSRKQRLERMAAFTKSGMRVMLATDAASEGLNLHMHCRRLYHIELPWNPNRMEQRNGRIDRHGQTRRPIIRYLFYPESPEDRILDKLVGRIVRMQEDRVSTPDIIGIISMARIEEALTGVDAEVDSRENETTLFRVIEERQEDFNREVAPILSAAGLEGEEADVAASCSADPLVGDDMEFETFISERLGETFTPSAIPYTFSLRTPRELKGPSVEDGYSCLTMRRSVAVAHPPQDVEFLTRLHPLFKSILDLAHRRLTATVSPTSPARRIAARRHPDALTPFAVFTYSIRKKGRHRALLAIAADSSGNVLSEDSVACAMDSGTPPGEVSWTELEKDFGEVFLSLQEASEKRANEVQDERIGAEAENRRRLATLLRDDAKRYRTDRLEEIGREERAAKAAEDRFRQIQLFEARDIGGFKAKRAAVETHHRRRLEDIEAFECPEARSPPQPLGVLFVFPGKK
jgi:superfamily II DNA or RNA helicase